MANPRHPVEVNFETRWNSRRKKECFIRGQHVSLQRLKERRSRNKMAEYLLIKIPPYPTPAEFWVSEVAHVTEESGFKGILESEQFSPIAGEFLWWGLKMNEDEIKAAEKCYMETIFPNEAQDLNEQRPFLEKFTTSPPFHLEESRYGNYRFTFPLTDLMQWYKEQNCRGEDPVLRVYETVTYRQQIVYTVLIHSPEDNQRFGEYPPLEESEWVQYQDGKIIWKAQAICETHWYQFISGEVQSLYTHEFYVWDHVSLVFHLPKCKAIKIPTECLIEALEACKLDEVDLSRYKSPKNREERFREADMKVSGLKKDLENMRIWL